MEFVLGSKILAVCLMDMVLGDPCWVPHPVRLIGATINRYEELISTICKSHLGKRVAGVVLALGLPSGCYVLVQELIGWINSLNQGLGILAWVVLGYTTLAARDLWDHAMCVYQAITKQELSDARFAVSRLVGRDTAQLSESDVVRATVESVAESSSDGIVAPLFYLVLGGPALAMAYKAVNTLDSMVGYRNVRYRDIGWAAARLDDVMNWIPARLTAVSLCLAAALYEGRGKKAWRMCWRDASKHPSPNSGWPEAAMAGALGVQLGGVNHYEGIVEERAKLGDSERLLVPAFIPLALRLITVAAIFVLIVCMMMVTLW